MQQVAVDHINGSECLLRALVAPPSNVAAKECTIVLQKIDDFGKVDDYRTPSVAFYAGEPIHGYVEVELGEMVRAKAIRVKFKGICNNCKLTSFKDPK